MNCPEWEERIALSDGGDREMERHVAECPGCQIFASGIQESLATLRIAHAEPLEAAHYTAVRARVLAQIEKERRWRLWPFAAAAAVLLAAWFVRPHPPQIEPPVVALAHPPAPVVSPMRQRAVPTAPKPEPLVMKIVTDNPDVVIYWISNTKGEY